MNQKREVFGRWKTRGRGPGVWKTRGVENTGSGGKHGVWEKAGVWWKARGLVENTGSGEKYGVWWKTRDLSRKHGVQAINKEESLFRPTMSEFSSLT